MPIPVSCTATRNVTVSVVTVLGVDANRYLALLGELDRVADQVDEDLADPAGVADQVVRHVGRISYASSSALGVASGASVLSVSAIVSRRRTAPAPARAPGLDLREVQDVVDDRQERLARRWTVSA
jgi:hypothetical protein